MTIFAKHINLSKFLSVTVLSNRATARLLVDKIREMKKNRVKLDFADVEFASRSFMDELNSLIERFDHIKFSKINMNDQVYKMDELVQNDEIQDSWSVSSNRRKNTDLVTM